MKKLKINFVIIAVVLGTIGGFAFKAPNHKPQDTTGSYWFNPAVTVYLGQGEVPAEQLATTCDGPATHPVCAKGYSEDQLIDDTNPSLGVKPGEKGNPEALIYNRLN